MTKNNQCLAGRSRRPLVRNTLGKSLLFGGFAAAIAAVALLGQSAASAGPVAPRSDAEGYSMIHKAQWWDFDRCRAWRRECAERWGWGSERWHRCVWRRGCHRHRYGDRWDR